MDATKLKPFNVDEELISNFYSEIKSLDKKADDMTSKDHIDRLNRPDPDEPLTDLKKRFRKLSLLVHPDKNPEDLERAQKSFEENPEDLKNCMDIVTEAKLRTEKSCEEKRKRSKKFGDGSIPEDDPDKYKYAIYVQTCTIFADLERLRVEEENKKVNERKRKAAEEEEAKFKEDYEKEWQKNYEQSRIERVSSWKNFTAKKAKKDKPIGGFKPPKPKAERR